MTFGWQPGLYGVIERGGFSHNKNRHQVNMTYWMHNEMQPLGNDMAVNLAKIGLIRNTASTRHQHMRIFTKWTNSSRRTTTTPNRNHNLKVTIILKIWNGMLELKSIDLIDYSIHIADLGRMCPFLVKFEVNSLLVKIVVRLLSFLALTDYTCSR